MIFIEPNIPMYVIGAAHANKERAKTLLGADLNRPHAAIPSILGATDLCGLKIHRN